MNLRAIKEHLERYFLTQYQNAYTIPGITSIRIRIKNYTPSPTRYLDLIRAMAPLFNVKVLRNEHLIDEGIYVIGRERLCNKFYDTLISIIQIVEARVKIFVQEDRVGLLHLAHEKSKRKGLEIFKFEKMIKEIQKDYDAYAKVRRIWDNEMADQVSFVTYMKTWPHLRTKTPLRWSL